MEAGAPRKAALRMSFATLCGGNRNSPGFSGDGAFASQRTGFFHAVARAK